MAIDIAVHVNADEALVAWRPTSIPPDWMGFEVWRRDAATGVETPLNNRIPVDPAGGPVPAGGVASTLSPIRRLMWIDYQLDEGEAVQYRVVPVRRTADGALEPVADEASPWSRQVRATGDGDGDLRAVFNRGTLMSQVVSRFVQGEPTPGRLKKLVKTLAVPGGAARRYLSGQARSEILGFLASADRRGSEVHAALYECNDEELIAALKAFGGRGHVLIGNGAGTREGLAKEMADAGLEVRTRDLSHSGASSPSVHNKFVVESQRGRAVRVLTGSTNWTVTGLCTQLNNVLVVDRPALAERYRDQWNALVTAGDDMPGTLKRANERVEVDGRTELYFSATPNGAELAAVEALIRGARKAVFFLMFMPGQSPVLQAALDRNAEARGPIVRGVVSSVTESKKGRIVSHEGRVVSKDKDLVLRETRRKTTILLPSGVKQASNAPKWAREEFAASDFLSAGLRAIVHSKVIVIDPWERDCAVVAGSHNFSPSASQKNDENLLIVRGDRGLAERYAVHIQSVYDHYSWRTFLHEGGRPDALQGLQGWETGQRAKDVAFWT